MRCFGNAAHGAIQSAYRSDYGANLVVVDGQVFLIGSDVGALSDLSDGYSTGNPVWDQELELYADALKFDMPNGRTSTLRTDIADFSAGTLYEIKPLSGAHEAVLQLWAYQAYINLGFSAWSSHDWYFEEGDWPSDPIWVR